MTLSWTVETTVLPYNVVAYAGRANPSENRKANINIKDTKAKRVLNAWHCVDIDSLSLGYDIPSIIFAMIVFVNIQLQIGIKMYK